MKRLLLLMVLGSAMLAGCTSQSTSPPAATQPSQDTLPEQLPLPQPAPAQAMTEVVGTVRLSQGPEDYHLPDTAAEGQEVHMVYTVGFSKELRVRAVVGPDHQFRMALPSDEEMMGYVHATYLKPGPTSPSWKCTGETKMSDPAALGLSVHDFVFPTLGVTPTNNFRTAPIDVPNRVYYLFIYVDRPVDIDRTDTCPDQQSFVMRLRLARGWNLARIENTPFMQTMTNVMPQELTLLPSYSWPGTSAPF